MILSMHKPSSLLEFEEFRKSEIWELFREFIQIIHTNLIKIGVIEKSIILVIARSYIPCNKYADELFLSGSFWRVIHSNTQGNSTCFT